MPSSDHPNTSARALRAKSASGYFELFPYSRAGGSLSCAFGRKGFRSSIWNVVATPAGDVFVSEQTMARELKTSLHASGQWQNAWVRDDGTKELTTSGKQYQSVFGTRIFDSHRRPSPGDAGITAGLHIVVCHDDVSPWPNDTIDAGDVVWSDTPPPGQAAVFAVLLQTPDDLQETKFLGTDGIVGVLGSGREEVVIVTASRHILSDQELGMMASFRADVRRLYTDEQIARLRLGPGERIRAQLVRPAPKGHREIWDMALPVERLFG